MSVENKLQRRNLVKKHMDKIHKPKVHRNKKLDYKRNNKHKKQLADFIG